MNRIQKEMKSRVDRHRDDLRAIRSCGDLVAVLDEICVTHWSTRTEWADNQSRWYNLRVGRSITLTIHLSKIDSLKYDIMDILQAIMDAGFDLQAEYHIEGQHKNWDFSHESATWTDIDGRSFPINLELYVNYTNSGRCTMVKVGEPEERTSTYQKTMLVCED